MKLSKTENPFKHILGFRTDLFVPSFIDLITEDLLQTRCCVQHSDNMTKTKPPLREHVKGLMGTCIGRSVEEEKGTHSASETEVDFGQILFISKH